MNSNPEDISPLLGFILAFYLKSDIILDFNIACSLISFIWKLTVTSLLVIFTGNIGIMVDTQQKKQPKILECIQILSCFRNNFASLRTSILRCKDFSPHQPKLLFPASDTRKAIFPKAQMRAKKSWVAQSSSSCLFQNLEGTHVHNLAS